MKRTPRDEAPDRIWRKMLRGRKDGKSLLMKPKSVEMGVGSEWRTKNGTNVISALWKGLRGWWNQLSLLFNNEVYVDAFCFISHSLTRVLTTQRSCFEQLRSLERLDCAVCFVYTDQCT